MSVRFLCIRIIVVSAFSACVGTAAFFSVAVLHILSARGIWTILPDAYQVREFSIYIIKTTFIFTAVFVLVSLPLAKWVRETSARLALIFKQTMTFYILVLMPYLFYNYI